MKSFTHLTSAAIPLPMKDVDTDMIIPAQYLTQINREGYGAFLFNRLKEQNLDFIFNHPDYQNAHILISQSNFGCGSSREHAVWALLQWGIQIIIAESFSDIFFNNAAKNGLLLIQLKKSTIDMLLAQAKKSELIISVDLPMQTITLMNGEIYHFDYDPFRKTCLLSGYNDLDYLLSTLPKIETIEIYEAR